MSRVQVLSHHTCIISLILTPTLEGRIIVIPTVQMKKLSSEVHVTCLRPHSQEETAPPPSALCDYLRPRMSPQ